MSSEFEKDGEGGGTITLEPPSTETKSKSKTRSKKKFSKQWKLILMDNDVTTMEFVILVLYKTFKYDLQKCYKLMAETHETGASVCFMGNKEICEFKLETALGIIKSARHECNRALEIKMESDEE
jgi:ATP-dependent Clp protease adaptor protein ClpS